MDSEHWLRVVLELLILGCLWYALRSLKRDWHVLRPPYWRLLVVAILLPLGGHAIATVLLLSIGSDITAGTWVGLATYIACASLLGLVARIRHR